MAELQRINNSEHGLAASSCFVGIGLRPQNPTMLIEIAVYKELTSK